MTIYIIINMFITLVLANLDNKSREKLMNLDRLDIGQKGRIVEVKGQGALRKRLLDLGLTPKTQVLVRKKAPLGDPIEIHLRGFELTLRKDEAKHVVVERDENDN